MEVPILRFILMPNARPEAPASSHEASSAMGTSGGATEPQALSIAEIGAIEGVTILDCSLEQAILIESEQSDADAVARLTGWRVHREIVYGRPERRPPTPKSKDES